ncbi:MAG: HPr family phosphocarrier protein [Clostridia bacterium]|nr:HPr family phosphocarrier protein [Clostridia bacterium]
MKELKIKLSNVQDIREFVNVIILADYDVDLVQGRYVIDAKSIMGIFSLDLLSPITLVAHSDNVDAIFEKLSKFTV